MYWPQNGILTALQSISALSSVPSGDPPWKRQVVA
jgi:hypothetical protein